MNTKLPPSGNSFQIGFYKVLNVDYPRATVSYKECWRDQPKKPRLIDFDVLFHPRSSGPKDLMPATLVGKVLQIIDAGQIKSLKNFQMQFIDFAVWRVINRAHIVEFDEQSASSQLPTDHSASRSIGLEQLNALSIDEQIAIYNQMKADPEAKLGFEEYDDCEFTNDLFEIEEDDPEWYNDVDTNEEQSNI